jgi:hypothetical protein
MILTGIAGWVPRVRQPDGRWLSAPEHTWEGVGEVEIDPADDRNLWAKRGPGILLSSREGTTADLFSRAELGSFDLYLEFLIPVESGSGVYLLGQYEVRIADTHELAEDELTDEASGGIEGHPPLANAALPPFEWQTLELTFRAPRFDDAGRKTANAQIEQVKLNDILVHGLVELPGPTAGALVEVDVPRGPIRLRGDVGPVAFRDIRMRTIFE